MRLRTFFHCVIAAALLAPFCYVEFFTTGFAQSPARTNGRSTTSEPYAPHHIPARAARGEVSQAPGSWQYQELVLSEVERFERIRKRNGGWSQWVRKLVIDSGRDWISTQLFDNVSARERMALSSVASKLGPGTHRVSLEQATRFKENTPEQKRMDEPDDTFVAVYQVSAKGDNDLFGRPITPEPTPQPNEQLAEILRAVEDLREQLTLQNEALQRTRNDTLQNRQDLAQVVKTLEQLAAMDRKIQSDLNWNDTENPLRNDRTQLDRFLYQIENGSYKTGYLVVGQDPPVAMDWDRYGTRTGEPVHIARSAIDTAGESIPAGVYEVFDDGGWKRRAYRGTQQYQPQVAQPVRRQAQPVVRSFSGYSGGSGFSGGGFGAGGG